MLAVGDRAPDVALRTQAREVVHVRDLYARGPVLLVFYLFDFSST